MEIFQGKQVRLKLKTSSLQLKGLKAAQVIEGTIVRVDQRQHSIEVINRQQEIQKFHGWEVEDLNLLLDLPQPPNLPSTNPTPFVAELENQQDKPRKSLTNSAKKKRPGSKKSSWATIPIENSNQTDFDFEGNLKMFDKEKEFENMKKTTMQ